MDQGRLWLDHIGEARHMRFGLRRLKRLRNTARLSASQFLRDASKTC
jgi:hypothetical protein